MKKGVEILKEVHFCKDKETADSYSMLCSDTLTFMQISIDYDNRFIRIYKKSNWNSSYDVIEKIPF